MIKKIFIILFFIAVSTLASAYDVIGLTKVEPEKNSYVHNNLGLGYMSAGQYDAAIQEFKIAISLCPNTQATAIYLNNLGETYLRLGYYTGAQDCFEKAINRYPLNFKYYLNVVTAYQMRGLLDTKLNQFQKHKRSPLDDILIGLIYVAKGQTKRGITVLDAFVMNEPKLLITDGVKYYLKGLIEVQKMNY